MIDNTLLIACISELLDCMEIQSRKPHNKAIKPLNLTLSHTKFDEVKISLEGTGFRPYGEDCNEESHYVGRPIVLRHGKRKSRCLVGVVTAFRVKALGQSHPDAQEKYLNIKSRKHNGQMKYNERTLIAEIDYELKGCTEYKMLSGTLVPTETFNSIKEDSYGV